MLLLFLGEKGFCHFLCLFFVLWVSCWFDRLKLLSMVKKHSKLLGKTIVDKEDASDVAMDSCFWHDVMNLYFVHGRESRGRQDDDLVFFV